MLRGYGDEVGAGADWMVPGRVTGRESASIEASVQGAQRRFELGDSRVPLFVCKLGPQGPLSPRMQRIASLECSALSELSFSISLD